jgi:membrane protein YqaA with SNARE-associated domain
LIKENLLKALAGIMIIIVAMSALGFWLENEMEIATNWVVDQIGFAGLCLILFITDTLVTPFPPDILLVVIANSDLAEHWLIYVLVLGLVSVVVGMLGWCLGCWLRHLKILPAPVWPIQ